MLSDKRNAVFWCWWAFTALLIIFWAIAGSSYDRLVFFNTLCLGVLSAAISIPFAAVLANAASRKTLLGRLTLVLTLAFAMVPIVFQVSCWDAAFGKLGWLTAKFTGTNQPIVSAWFATIWIHAVALAPQIAVLFLVAILGGRRTHEEQALMDTTPSQVFWKVSLPRFFPVMGVALIWSIISCSKEIAVTDIYQIGTVAEQVYLGFSLGQFRSLLGTGPATDLAADNTLSLGLQLSTIAWLVLSAITVFLSLLRTQTNSTDFIPTTKQQAQNGVGKLITTLALLVLFGLPAWNLIARASFQVVRVNGQPTGLHSMDNFFFAIRRAVFDYSPQTYWSLIVGACCLVITLILSILFVGLAKQRRYARLLVLGSVAICFALPGPVIGTGLLKIYTWIDSSWIEFLYNRTVAPVIFADVIVCLPITILLLWFVTASSPSDAREHLSMEGAGEWRVFWQLGVVANWVPIVGISILCFIQAYGDLSASQMVLPPGVETVPRLTLGLMHAGVNEMTAALSIVNISVILLVSLVGWKLVSLKWRNRKQQ